MPYNLSNYSEQPDGFTADLSYTKSLGVDETVIPNLSLTVKKLSGSQLRITILDRDAKRWEVPHSTENMNPGKWGDESYDIAYTETPFSLKVTRKADSAVIFNIAPGVEFKYNDRDLIVANTVGYDVNVYGLGERVTDFRLNQGAYEMWSFDNASPYDDGKSGGKNMYGVHPFYVATDQ